MLFRVEDVSGRTTHCGVLEFLAEEGIVYMPHWVSFLPVLLYSTAAAQLHSAGVSDSQDLRARRDSWLQMMQNLLLQVGDMVKFTNVSLPKGQYVTSDFLDITNPKAVLERALRSYTCLTTGDVFPVMYNNKVFEFEVMETKPGRAISVVETDCEVDFAPPKDYKEPPRQQPSASSKPDAMQGKPMHNASGGMG
jgi:ubiquitin fusion degradation protein 1